MPILGPLILSVNLSQTGWFKDITKNYVTMASISQIDILFAQCLPDCVLKNAELINKNKLMVIKKDYNTNTLIKERIQKCLNDDSLSYDVDDPDAPPSRKTYLKNSIPILMKELINLSINGIVSFHRNIQIIFFNYSSAFFVLFIQILGYYL